MYLQSFNLWFDIQLAFSNYVSKNLYYKLTDFFTKHGTIISSVIKAVATNIDVTPAASPL